MLPRQLVLARELTEPSRETGDGAEQRTDQDEAQTWPPSGEHQNRPAFGLANERRACGGDHGGRSPEAWPPYQPPVAPPARPPTRPPQGPNTSPPKIPPARAPPTLPKMAPTASSCWASPRCSADFSASLTVVSSTGSAAGSPMQPTGPSTPITTSPQRERILLIERRLCEPCASLGGRSQPRAGPSPKITLATWALASAGSFWAVHDQVTTNQAIFLVVASLFNLAINALRTRDRPRGERPRVHGARAMVLGVEPLTLPQGPGAKR